MTLAAFTSQMTKLRRGSTAWILVAGAVLTAIATFISVTGPADVSAGPAPVGVSVEQLQMSDGIVAGMSQASDFLGLLVLGVFAFGFGSEFSQGTIRNLLVRQPGRLTLLAGTFLGLTSLAVLMAVLATAVSAAVSLAVAPGQGIDTSAWTVDSVALQAAMASVALVGYGAIGAALGLMLRSPVAAMGIGALYLLPLETIASAAWDGADAWLPGRLLAIVIEGGTATVDLETAALRSFFVLVLLASVAAISFSRRDVLE